MTDKDKAETSHKVDDTSSGDFDSAPADNPEAELEAAERSQVGAQSSDSSADDSPSDLSTPAESDSAEVPDTPQKTETLKKKTKEKTKRTIPLVLIAVAVCFITTAALIVGGVFYVKQQQEQWLSEQLSGLTQNISSLQNDLSNLSQSHSETKSDLSSSLNSHAESWQQAAQQLKSQQSAQQKKLDQALAQQREQVDQLQQRVDGQQRRLTSLSTTSREDWLLAEAEYLLRLANQRVLLERSPANAIALMEAADSIVQEVAGGLGDAELFAIREAIARELTELKLVPEVDKDGLYLKLQGLAERVETLPRIPPSELGAVGAQQEDAADADEGRSWWARLKNELAGITGTLNNYIKFEDVDTPGNPLIASHAAQIAALNVRIAIEQAQVALLKEQQTVYQSALAKAEEMVGEFYFPSDASKRYRDSLQQIAQTNVAPKLPDISGSLKLLNGYLVNLHRLQDQPEGQL